MSQNINPPENVMVDEKSVEIDEGRLQLERQRMAFEQGFWHRNFGTMTTFSVAFLGFVLSVAQVWVAYLQKDREALQKQQEITIAQLEKDRDFQAQEKRDIRDFVTKNESSIFSVDQQAREKK